MPKMVGRIRQLVFKSGFNTQKEIQLPHWLLFTYSLHL